MNIEHNGKHHRFTYGLNGVFTSYEVAAQVKERDDFCRAAYGLLQGLQGAHTADVQAALGFAPNARDLWTYLGDIAPDRRADVLKELGLIKALVEGEEAARG